MVFEYTGVGCSVPKDVISVRFNEGVQKIEEDAFYDCKSLKSITLPSTIAEIGNYAFRDCCNLREVILNEGLQKIGRMAFYKSTSLESITIPSTVTEIGDGAFNDCSNLREVIFNNGLQKIGNYAFLNCTSLESITLPSTLVEIGRYVFEGCGYLEEVKLNHGLQKIGEEAFNSTSLQSITLPPTVTEIGNYAFRFCSNLREVEMNAVPQYVHSEAFRNCYALERVLFPTISYRLVKIIQTNHWEDLEDKLNELRGVVQWENDKLFVSRSLYQNWDDIRRDFSRIVRLVSYYEVKEATSTFDLAWWKFNLDQVDAINTTNDAAYRIDVPGPVKDTILQYLDHPC